MQFERCSWTLQFENCSSNIAVRTLINLIKENGFTLKKRKKKKKKKKARSRWYPAETIKDADYVDNIAFLTNTPALAESLLYSLEQAARGINLHVKVNKMTISVLNEKVLGLWNWKSNSRTRIKNGYCLILLPNSIAISKVKLANVVAGDLMAPFSIATISGGHYSFPLDCSPLPLICTLLLNAKQGGIKYHF